MVVFILILLGAAYVAGAIFGLPKFKKSTNNGLADRKEFLASLVEGDRIKTFTLFDNDAITYNFTRTYTVVDNYPEIEILSVREYRTDNPKGVEYDSKFLKNLLTDNLALVSQKIKQAKENARKEQNND